MLLYMFSVFRMLGCVLFYIFSVSGYVGCDFIYFQCLAMLECYGIRFQYLGMFRRMLFYMFLVCWCVILYVFSLGMLGCYFICFRCLGMWGGYLIRFQFVYVGVLFYMFPVSGYVGVLFYTFSVSGYVGCYVIRCQVWVCFFVHMSRDVFLRTEP